MTEGLSLRAATVLALVLVPAGCDRRAADTARAPRAATPGVRITMAALHQAGGVPTGWRFTPPPGDVAAGRRTFAELGCQNCHVVRGEPFTTDTKTGPELTGMGAHHPAGYFVETILNPDAVLVEGPGYIGPDGRSTMPSYPDLTAAQLADLVAYLQSLTAGQQPAGRGAAAVDHAAMGHGVLPASELPAAPVSEARSFFVQTYEVKDGKLGEFEQWFRTEGAPAFLAFDGLVGIETYVDLTRDGPAYATVFGFRDEQAQRRFLADIRTVALGERFDSFIGVHPHRTYEQLPVYRAASLSAP